MSLHDTVDRLGQDTADTLVGLFGRWQDGDLTETEFRTLAEAVLIRAGARSAALADVALTAALTAARRSPAVPVGIEPSTDAQGAVQETLTSVSFERDAAAAVAVLGSAVVFEQFQTAYGRGMKSQGVRYWERVPNAGACEVCMDLSEGIVSADIPLWHHKGCMCVARPITN